MKKSVLLCCLVFCSTLLGCSKAQPSAMQADRVLVIENVDSPISKQITQHYMSKRGVKKSLQVHCPDSAAALANETMPYAQFKEAIEKPLKDYLAKDPQIDFIVLTKGVPIRLTGAPVGLNNSQPSLDSYIAALNYFDRSSSLKVIIDEGGFKGNCFVNNFFNSNDRFSHAKHGGYLVTRLDGYTVEAALALVDNSIASDSAKPTGNFFWMPTVLPMRRILQRCLNFP